MHRFRIGLRKVVPFARDESGAVTVDWVVLTGAIVFLGLAIAFIVTASVPDLAEGIKTYMTDYKVGE